MVLKMSKVNQMSDTFINAVFLTLSGGLQDAYTYMGRGKVFANAQTGNVVLMGKYLFDGDFTSSLRYLVPVCAFMAGIFTAELVHRHFKNTKAIHWRQFILILEILLLFVSGFIPNSLNMLSNIIISFVCAMQVQSFRTIDGLTYASTMCIGNIRLATDSLCAFCHSHNKEDLNKSLKYFSVILLFSIGAGLGSVLTAKYGNTAIWASCMFLSVSFCIMLIKKRKYHNN